MGWRRILRSAAAASRRNDRARISARNARNRVSSKLDRNAGEAIARAEKLEAQISRDIIKAFNLRYDLESGFCSDRVDIGAGVFTGSVGISKGENEAPIQFSPPGFAIEDSRVEILDSMITRWATLVAIKVQCSNPQNRIKLNWFKRTNRNESKIYIVDKINGCYYFPLASDLVGEAIPNAPRIGIVAFEPFRNVPSQIELFISNARFTPQKFEHTLTFGCTDPALASTVVSALNSPSFTDQIRNSLQREVERANAIINRPAKSSCLIMALMILVLGTFCTLLPICLFVLRTKGAPSLHENSKMTCSHYETVEAYGTLHSILSKRPFLKDE